MDREEISPLATSVTLGENIYRVIDEISGLLTIGLMLSVWVVLFGVLWVLQNFVRIEHPIAWTILGTLGVALWLLSIPAMIFSYKRLKTLKKWDEDFIRFSYVLKFEILPSENPDPIQRIFEQTLNVFVRLGDIFETNQIDHKPFREAQVEGKKGPHYFDIYIGVENAEDKELFDFHKNNGDLFIRRFAKTSPIEESDLKTFFDEVADVVKETKSDTVFRIVAVSKSSFDESAKAFVKNKKNWIKRKSADLVEETAKGFRVIWVS